MKSPKRIAAILTAVLLTGCSQDMARQPKYHYPDMPSDFFADGRSDRPIEADTVARGQLRDDKVRFTGRKASQQANATQAAGAVAVADPVTALVLLQKPAVGERAEEYSREFPFPIDEAKLKRGQERYTIYCAMCHDRLGSGNGKIIQRGYAKPPSYQIDRLRDAPVGYFYEVITRGYGAMPDYAEQIPSDDRWLIVAYVKTLQASRVPAAAVSEDRRKNAIHEGGRSER